MTFIESYLARRAKERRLVKKLRRLVHQRNYWRNRTRKLRGQRKR